MYLDVINKKLGNQQILNLFAGISGCWSTEQLNILVAKEDPH